MSSVLLLALQTSIATAQTATQSAITTMTAQVEANPLPAAGTAPGSAATSLTNQLTAMTQLYQLYQLSSVLGRMGVNAANAGN